MKSDKIEEVLQKNFIFSLIIVLAFIIVLKEYVEGSYNNHKVLKYKFCHRIKSLPLYKLSPIAYADSNYYEPVFTLLIAPIVLLYDTTRTTLLNVFNGLILFIGIYSLIIKQKLKSLIATFHIIIDFEFFSNKSDIPKKIFWN